MKSEEFASAQNASNEYVRKVAEQKYEFGFTTDVHTEIIPVGLNEDIVRLISAKKGEPEWMLAFRLKAFRYWQEQTEPKWGHVHVPPIDYQAISYYADPMVKKPKGDGKIDPELEKTFDKLGIPLEERLALSGNTAVDAIMDSVSVKTTFKEKLREKGVIFCSIGDAIKEHPDLVREYLGSVVPYRDNYFAALNSAVFSDGSFVYIPKGVRCPMELSSYFRINARNTGQFERTLIIADDDAYVSYLEGCTAPMRDENQLHAAIVEIIVKDRAEVKYSTVQNWYPGDEQGRGGVLNLVTKRGDLRGVDSKLSWTQVETGSAITWKYPSCILRGDNSQAEFYSVAVTNNYQEADTGTKMIHIGKNTKSTIISKGISAGHSQNSYRGLVRATSNADNARNYSSCDSLLLGSDCGAHTFPYMDVHNDTAVFEHEATTSKISEDQLFYCNQRGIPTEQAVGLIVNGYAKEVLQKLPMEFAVEAQKLLSVQGGDRWHYHLLNDGLYLSCQSQHPLCYRYGCRCRVYYNVYLCCCSYFGDGALCQTAFCLGSWHGTECILCIYRRANHGLFVAVCADCCHDRGTHLHPADCYRLAPTYCQCHSLGHASSYQSRNRTLYRFRRTEGCWYSGFIRIYVYHTG